jgi:AcrR family transcriptional regulator
MKLMDDKKEHILITAERLFAEGGFDGTSVRKIAQEAGVNIAMINYYFTSKEGLLKSIIEYRVRTFSFNLNTVWDREAAPWDKVNGYVDQVIDQMVDNPCFTRIVNMELTVLQRPEIVEIISQYIRRNSQMFYQLLEECNIDLTSELKMLPNMFFGYTAQIVTSPYFYTLTMVSDLDPNKILEPPYKEEFKENIKGFIGKIFEKLCN